MLSTHSIKIKSSRSVDTEHSTREVRKSIKKGALQERTEERMKHVLPTEDDFVYKEGRGDSPRYTLHLATR